MRLFLDDIIISTYTLCMCVCARVMRCSPLLVIIHFEENALETGASNTKNQTSHHDIIFPLRCLSLGDVHIIPLQKSMMFTSFPHQFLARWFTANQLKPRRGFRATVLQIGFMMELWFVPTLSTCCSLEGHGSAGEDGTCL